VALASAGAESIRLETTLEGADRELTAREADSAALVIAQMRELVVVPEYVGSIRAPLEAGSCQAPQSKEDTG
jgi:hypothetical protein